MEAIGVTTGGVHGSDEGLQADVAHQLIVHIVLVFVQMAFKAFMLLTTLLTDACPRQTPRAAAGFGLCCSHGLIKFTLSCSVWKEISQSPFEFWYISSVPQIPEVIPYFFMVFFWETKAVKCTMGLLLLRPSSSTGNDKSTGQQQNGNKPQLLPLSEFPEGQKEFSQLEVTTLHKNG